MTVRLTLENFVNRSHVVHNHKYDYSNVLYVNARTKVTIECPIHGNFEQTPDAHLHGQDCPKCGNKKIGDKLRHDNQKIDEYLTHNNIQILRMGEYKNSGAKLEFQCLQCVYKWKTTTEHIKDGTGCPNCANVICDNFKIDRILEKYSRDILRLENYINAHTKIEWQCTKCNFIWKALPSSIMVGNGCPSCACFKNEKIVGKLLNKLGIIYKKICIKIDNKRYYPDYFLPEMNLIIEYNGKQHYEPVRFGNLSFEKAVEKFKKQQLRDQKLQNYCVVNGIKLLEIDGRKYTNKKLHAFLELYFGELYMGDKK